MSAVVLTSPVMILAGGTGGHIFPGLAVARALRERSVPVLWLGAHGGMETRLVPANDFPIETIAVRGLRGKGLLTKLSAPFVVLRSLLQAMAVLRRVRPRAVVSFGGFAAGPGGLAAWLLRRPLIVHEQNRAPGMTNRVLARLARRVLCGFPDSFPSVANETVGNPVRPEISALPPPSERLASHSGPVRLLVLGGSQGARAINNAVPKVVASLQSTTTLDIRHQCGEKMLDETRAAYVAAGVASVLVPFPGAVDDHQARNADYLKERGGGDWLRQDAELENGLRQRLQTLLGDREKLHAMAAAARAAAYPNAAQRVADIAMQEARA